jgi:hypothetical protein
MMRGKSRSTKASIEEAVSRVLDGGETIEQVAASSSVHVLTIRKYLALRKQQLGVGDVGMDPAAAGAAGGPAPARRGRKPVLDPAAELELLEHVLQLAAQGAEVTSEQVLQLANDKALQIHGESSTRPTLTLSWLRRFKERHPSLPLQYIPAALPSAAPAPSLHAPFAGMGGLPGTSMGLQPPPPPQQQQPVKQQPTQDAASGGTGSGDSLSKRGRKPILDAQAEQDIMDALTLLEQQGQRVTSETILQLARDKVREVSGGASQPVLSMSWLQRFKERHPTLFSDRVRQKRGREDDELDLAALGSASSATAGVPAPRVVRPRPSEAFQSPLAAAAALTNASATNGRAVGTAAGPSQRTDELLQSLVRMSEKIVDMQNRQLDVLVQLVAAIKDKQV